MLSAWSTLRFFLPSLISSPVFPPFLPIRGGRREERGEGTEDVLCVSSSPARRVWLRGSLAGEAPRPQDPPDAPGPAVPGHGPAAADFVCDLDFLGWSSQCLDGCAGGLCGPRIVKAICLRDATCWSGSVSSQGREGRERSSAADFPIPFLSLSGKRLSVGEAGPMLGTHTRVPAHLPTRSGALQESWGEQPGHRWQRLRSDVSAPCV